jgi:hypothetical protein
MIFFPVDKVMTVSGVSSIVSISRALMMISLPFKRVTGIKAFPPELIKGEQNSPSYLSQSIVSN